MDPLLGGLLAVMAQASPDSAGVLTPPSIFEDGGYASLLVRTVVTLVIIIGILYVVVRWGVPRLFRWRVASARSMVLVDRLPLGGGRSVCVVRAVGRYYLVGVTDGQIQLLSELTDEQVETHYPALATKERA